MENCRTKYLDMNCLTDYDTGNNVKEWYYTNATCCQSFCIRASNNCCRSCIYPVSVDELHHLWLTNMIHDTTKVFSHVTAYPVEINEIWKRNLSTNTVEIRKDSFNIGDVVQFKPWIRSPSPNSDWKYISKYQTGTVSDIDHESDQFGVQITFETGITRYCEQHEIFNVTIKNQNAEGIKKYCSIIKKPIDWMNGLYSKFKNHVIGLLFTLFTECYDIVTDVLFTLLLYSRNEMDLFIVSVCTLCVPSILSCCVSWWVIAATFDPDYWDKHNVPNTKPGVRTYCIFCVIMSFCSCCSCALFPFTVIISTLIKLCWCIMHRTWYFTDELETAYGKYPCVLFQTIMHFCNRLTEDLPQVVVNIIFIYDRNNSKLEWINVLSMIGSGFMIIKTILFGWKEISNANAFTSGLGDPRSTPQLGMAISAIKNEEEFANSRRRALGLQVEKVMT